jgi:hypothetical protein
VALLAAWPALVGAQGGARVSFASPAEGSTVTGPKVEVKLKIENFKTVAAGSPVAAGEGHAHIFIDREPVAAGTAIPTDQQNIVHLGAAPFDTRTIDLQPGRHTLNAQLADSSHKALTPAVTGKATFTVRAAGAASPPAKAADTGDGSLATPAAGIGGLIAVALAALALGARRLVRP